MTWMKPLTIAVAIGILATPAIEQTVQAKTVFGTSQKMGQGSIRSFAKIDDKSKQVTEIGVVFSDSALNKLPTETTEYNLPLPKGIPNLPFTHVGVDWQPHGHPPEPIYGNAHFDFHFYVISQKDRQQITVKGLDSDKVYKQPESKLIPPGYVLAPDSGEPTQGSHWINPKSSEFQGQPHGFGHTLVYGFYNGHLSFVEPMISKALLEKRQALKATIVQPSSCAQPGLYPTSYSLSHDAKKHTYTLTLSGLTACQ